LPKLKSGGYLYLDNSDKDMTAGGDMRDAERVVLDAVAQRSGSATYYTDFAPAQVVAMQGLLARL
jgi:hypothetical protein